MKVRVANKLENGMFEWSFGHSLGDYKSGQNQVIQDIYTALYEWKYDCFFAMQNGIDYSTRLGYKNQKDLLDDDIRQVIESRIGVLAVNNFESNVIGRQYTCTCDVFTEFSEDLYTLNFVIEV